MKLNGPSNHRLRQCYFVSKQKSNLKYHFCGWRQQRQYHRPTRGLGTLASPAGRYYWNAPLPVCYRSKSCRLSLSSALNIAKFFSSFYSTFSRKKIHSKASGKALKRQSRYSSWKLASIAGSSNSPKACKICASTTQPHSSCFSRTCSRYGQSSFNGPRRTNASRPAVRPNRTGCGRSSGTFPVDIYAFFSQRYFSPFCFFIRLYGRKIDFALD